MLQTLKVYGIPPTQNEFRKIHRLKLNSIKKEWERIIWVLVKDQQIKPVEQVVMTYEFWFKDKTRRDPDNYAACAKMIQDGLVKAKILPDDNFNHVRELRIKHGGISDKPYVLIHLMPVEEAS